jgi:arylsulfatase A
VDHLTYFPDIMPTLAEMSGAECPKTDGLSILPELTGEGVQQKHEYLYWEYQGQTAVRYQDWKAYKGRKNGWELYDLAKDVEEKVNLASQNKSILDKLKAFATEAHEDARPGEIHNKELTDKDHRQSPNKNNKLH